MTILGLDGIELDVWNDGIFMVDPLRYDSGVLLNMLMYGGIDLYLDHCDIDLSQYLADPDPSTVRKEAEERGYA
ncbi:hypothetical protein Tco_0268793 [Tanacetum coccineum]